tara:strand:- start:2090 stop:2248 length:159 start_codon:yes stop_codon:yes gene_type:complete
MKKIAARRNYKSFKKIANPYMQNIKNVQQTVQKDESRMQSLEAKVAALEKKP